jgi:hypothetical protein
VFLTTLRLVRLSRIKRVYSILSSRESCTAIVDGVVPSGTDFPMILWARLPDMKEVLRGSDWNGGLDLHNPNNLVILAMMSFDPKNLSDHGSVGEELMINVSELEETGAVVEKAVREGYFTLPEALSAYRLSEIEYVAYLLLKKYRQT